MRTVSRLLAAFLSLAPVLPASAAGPAPKSRVVALTPALAAICYDILPEPEYPRVVGVSVHTRPPAGQSPVIVASATTLDREKLAALKPGLVFRDPDSIRSMEGAVAIRTSSISEIAAAYRRVGRLLSHGGRGEELASAFEHSIRRLKDSLSGTFFFQLDADPLVAVGGGRDFLPELLKWMGARNIFAETGHAYPRVTEEAVVSRDPDFIVVLGLKSERARFEDLASRWGRRHPSLRAVRERKVVVLDADDLTLPSLRLVEGARALVGRVAPGPGGP